VGVLRGSVEGVVWRCGSVEGGVWREECGGRSVEGWEYAM